MNIEWVVCVQESKIPNPIHPSYLPDSLTSLIWKLLIFLALSWCSWTRECGLPKLVDLAMCILLSDPTTYLFLQLFWVLASISVFQVVLLLTSWYPWMPFWTPTFPDLCIKPELCVGALQWPRCMCVFFLTSRNIGIHILAYITVLLPLTRSGLWKSLNLVACYCHRDPLSVNYTRQKEPILAGAL